MNITKKILLSDFNSISLLTKTDSLIPEFDKDNIYICDLVECDEKKKPFILNSLKSISVTSDQIFEASKLSLKNNVLSLIDFVNLILARDYNFTLVTLDAALAELSNEYNIKVITLKNSANVC